MAKMFYSSDEVQEKLGKSEAEVKSLVEAGQLREFRDGAKIMFKVTDVDALCAPAQEDVPGDDLTPEPELDLLGGSSEMGLAPLDDSAPSLSLADSVDSLSLAGDDEISLGGSAIDLSPMGESDTFGGLDLGGTGSGISLADVDASGGFSLADDDKINLDDSSLPM